MDITAQRQAVVAEAKTWIGTGFHHEARIKGAGVDCAQLLIAVFSACGFVPEFTTPTSHSRPSLEPIPVTGRIGSFFAY